MSVFLKIYTTSSRLTPTKLAAGFGIRESPYSSEIHPTMVPPLLLPRLGLLNFDTLVL